MYVCGSVCLSVPFPGKQNRIDWRLPVEEQIPKLHCNNLFDDKWKKAHKVILSGSSNFLRDILLDNWHEHPHVYLTSITMINLEAVFQFIYLGEVKVGKDKVNPFLETAKELVEVDGLKEVESKNSTNSRTPEIINTDQIHLSEKLEDLHGSATCIDNDFVKVLQQAVTP